MEHLHLLHEQLMISIILPTHKQRHGDRVTHPKNELLVLVVGDLRFVHPEGVDGGHHLVVRQGKQVRLCVLTFHEATLADKKHTIRICLREFLCFTGTYQFTCGFVATYQRYHQRQNWQKSFKFHIHQLMLCSFVFMFVQPKLAEVVVCYKYRTLLYRLVRLGRRISNPYAR